MESQIPRGVNAMRSISDDLSDRLFDGITPESSQRELEDLLNLIPTDPDYDTYYSFKPNNYK